MEFASLVLELKSKLIPCSFVLEKEEVSKMVKIYQDDKGKKREDRRIQMINVNLIGMLF